MAIVAEHFVNKWNYYFEYYFNVYFGIHHCHSDNLYTRLNS